jgi:hypothetical protein
MLPDSRKDLQFHGDAFGIVWAITNQEDTNPKR